MLLTQWKGNGFSELSTLEGVINIVISPSLSRATQIKTYSWDNAQVILVGNKCDMEEERVIPTEKGRLLAEQLGMCLTYVSGMSLSHVCT